MQVQPYLFFEGRCEEAIDYYCRKLGARLDVLMRYREAPDPTMVPPGADDKVMHAAFRIGDTTLMASDGVCSGTPGFQGFSLSITTPSVAKAEQLFAALAQDGQVQMPLAKTFYSPAFGMVADRYGLSWMIMAEP